MTTPHKEDAGRTGHTPLPWEFNGGDSLPILHIYAPDNKHVFHQSRGLEEHEANAAFIVRAVNSHADLVAALKAVLNSDMAMREEDEGNISDTLSIVRAALYEVAP